MGSADTRAACAFDAADVNLEDLLGGMFGGGSRRRARPSRGADLETEVTLSFDDAMAGVTVPVTLTGPAPCTTCHGSGAAPGTQPVTCPTCRGSGQVAVNQGLFSMAQTCPQCRGTGRLIETPCPTCGGVGATRRKRTIQVKVPAGVRDGARIKLAGKGESGAAGGHRRRSLCACTGAPARALRSQGQRPDGRRAGHVPRGRARRARPGADVAGPGHAEGARRHPER